MYSNDRMQNVYLRDVHVGRQAPDLSPPRQLLCTGWGPSIPRSSADRKPKWLMKLSYHEQAFRARYQSPQRGACQRHKSFLSHSYVLGSFSLLVHRASGGALMRAYRQPDFELTTVQWRKTRPTVQQQGHGGSQLAVGVWWLRALCASPTQHW